MRPRHHRLAHPDLDFWVDVTIRERDGRHVATADLAEDSRDVGGGGTPQEAVRATLRSLGEPLTFDLHAVVDEGSIRPRAGQHIGRRLDECLIRSRRPLCVSAVDACPPARRSSAGGIQLADRHELFFVALWLEASLVFGPSGWDLEDGHAPLVPDASVGVEPGSTVEPMLMRTQTSRTWRERWGS